MKNIFALNFEALGTTSIRDLGLGIALLIGEFALNQRNKKSSAAPFFLGLH
jgi:hypothetical protein